MTWGRCVAQATDQTRCILQQVLESDAMRASLSHSVATRERRSANGTDEHREAGRELDERERGCRAERTEEEKRWKGCLMARGCEMGRCIEGFATTVE